MNNDIKAVECLKALQIVNKYLEEEEAHCGDIEWIDKKGYSIHTDIGYFFEGLEMLESCLVKRLRGAKPEYPRACENTKKAVKWDD